MEALAFMGFTEIRMLGIDLRYDMPDTHFFGTSGKHKAQRGIRPREREMMVQKDARAIGRTWEILTHRGVRIVNESPAEGPLDAFIPREESRWLKRS